MSINLLKSLGSEREGDLPSNDLFDHILFPVMRLEFLVHFQEDLFN